MSESERTRRPRIVFPSRLAPVSLLAETVEAPFPERLTIHWLPPDMAMTEGFSIVITSEVLVHASHHVARTLTHELGGFLLGNRCRCPNTGREYITIDQYLEAQFTKSTDVSLTFTPESWAQLDTGLTGKFYGKKLLGWYHSHPTMSIFLSEDDQNLHRERFADPWMVALVLEPEKHIGGFFAWNNGKIDPNRYVNFYELLDGETRESVVAWKNYQGIDPIHSAPPPLSSNNTQSRWELVSAPTERPAQPSMALERLTPPPIKPQLRPQLLTAALIFLVFIPLGWGTYRLWQRWNNRPDEESARTHPGPAPQPSASVQSSPSPSPQTLNTQNIAIDDKPRQENTRQPKKNTTPPLARKSGGANIDRKRRQVEQALDPAALKEKIKRLMEEKARIENSIEGRKPTKAESRRLAELKAQETLINNALSQQKKKGR